MCDEELTNRIKSLVKEDYLVRSKSFKPLMKEDYLERFKSLVNEDVRVEGLLRDGREAAKIATEAFLSAVAPFVNLEKVENSNKHGGE